MHQGRRYVVGKPGNEYSIRVRNQSGGRVLTVMSVDGVNAISGDTASTAQTGYVLSPYESADIAGWRKSMSNTARVLLHDAARFVRRAHRQAGQCRRDWRRRVPRAAAPGGRAATGAPRSRARCRRADGQSRQAQLGWRAQLRRGSRTAAESRHRARPQRIVVRELHPVRARQHGARADDHDLLRLVSESIWRRVCRSALRALRAGSLIRFPIAADSRRTRAEFASPRPSSDPARAVGRRPHPAMRTAAQTDLSAALDDGRRLLRAQAAGHTGPAMPAGADSSDEDLMLAYAAGDAARVRRDLCAAQRRRLSISAAPVPRRRHRRATFPGRVDESDPRAHYLPAQRQIHHLAVHARPQPPDRPPSRQRSRYAGLHR